MDLLTAGKTARCVIAVISVLYVLSAVRRYRKTRTVRNRNHLFHAAVFAVFACALSVSLFLLPKQTVSGTDVPFSPDDIPAYEESPYAVINGNRPYFTEEEMKSGPYEFYSELDPLGRCGYAMAMLDRSLMPAEEREDLETIRPSGYHNAVYDDLIEYGFLYNRCHLIGFQLAGENANEKNLITGTRYLNVEGMEPFENEVAYYIRRTGKKVLYRVTPVFKDTELVCRGVLMEAYSAEDKGKEICFCVYCYNVQPGIEIDYRDGTSRRR